MIIVCLIALWVIAGIYWMVDIPCRWINVGDDWSIKNVPNRLLLVVLSLIAMYIGAHVGPFAYIPYAISRDTHKKYKNETKVS
jgi:hypothetical protein